jgi:DNA-binding NarL/FixJ family response regulator
MTTPTLSNITDAEAALILAIRGLLGRGSTPDHQQALQPLLPVASEVQPPSAARTYNPTWKTASSSGRQFTQEGVNAIAGMFKDGLSNKEVANLMQIGPGSAATYRLRYEGKLPWGRFKPQP